MKNAVSSQFKLENREYMDIIEAYLGDCAHLFRWIQIDHKKEGYVESIKNFGTTRPGNPKEKTQKTCGIKIKVDLPNYPTDAASVRATVNLPTTYGSSWITFAIVNLSDPGGFDFFNKKIKNMIFTFDSIGPKNE